jgi:hypothetical protein
MILQLKNEYAGFSCDVKDQVAIPVFVRVLYVSLHALDTASGIFGASFPVQ